MMFAGLTSAYIVKREQPGWTTYNTPLAFYYSTAVMLISSLTIFLAGKSFVERRMIRYRKLVAATAIWDWFLYCYNGWDSGTYG